MAKGQSAHVDLPQNVSGGAPSPQRRWLGPGADYESGEISNPNRGRKEFEEGEGHLKCQVRPEDSLEGRAEDDPEQKAEGPGTGGEEEDRKCSVRHRGRILECGRVKAAPEEANGGSQLVSQRHHHDEGWDACLCWNLMHEKKTLQKASDEFNRRAMLSSL